MAVDLLGEQTKELGTQIRENKTKWLKMRVEPSFLYEVKLQSNQAGYPDVATYIRHLIKEPREIEAFKQKRAEEIVTELKRFGISLDRLRKAGLME